MAVAESPGWPEQTPWCRQRSSQVRSAPESAARRQCANAATAAHRRRRRRRRRSLVCHLISLPTADDDEPPPSLVESDDDDDEEEDCLPGPASNSAHPAPAGQPAAATSPSPNAGSKQPDDSDGIPAEMARRMVQGVSADARQAAVLGGTSRDRSRPDAQAAAPAARAQGGGGGGSDSDDMPPLADSSEDGGWAGTGKNVCWKRRRAIPHSQRALPGGGATCTPAQHSTAAVELNPNPPAHACRDRGAPSGCAGRGRCRRGVCERRQRAAAAAAPVVSRQLRGGGCGASGSSRCRGHPACDADRHCSHTCGSSECSSPGGQQRRNGSADDPR